MTPNVPLLRKITEWCEEQEARTEDREWYQGDWITPTTNLGGEGWCETAFCVAGKLAVDAGWRPIRIIDHYDSYVTRDGETQDVEDVAVALLGLRSSGSALFDSQNTAADIRRIAEDIAGERL